MALELPLRLPRSDSARGSHPRASRLDDKYPLDAGHVFLSGIQALVRVALDQHRADRARRPETPATFVSGYQGSPLGGFDKELQRLRASSREHGIHHQPGLNEELAATAVYGSQLAPNAPAAPTVDGVRRLLVRQEPRPRPRDGRAAPRQLRRRAPEGRRRRPVPATTRPASPPRCRAPPRRRSPRCTCRRSSPARVQEVLDLGRHAVACSRASGLWSALKIVTNVADAAGTAQVGPTASARSCPTVECEGGPYVHEPNGLLLAPGSLELERTLLGPRLELARAVRPRQPPQPRHVDARTPGSASSPPARSTTSCARRCATLGDRRGARRHPPPAVGMLYPLDRAIFREFARGLDEILVVEEKRPFLETRSGRALRPAPTPARRRRATRAPSLDAATTIARVVAARLRRPRRRARLRRGALERPRLASHPRRRRGRARTHAVLLLGLPAQPLDRRPRRRRVGVGIGCHTMVLLTPTARARSPASRRWAARARSGSARRRSPSTSHLVQNLGDGTFHHSGSLAIRAAVAAGVNITYKLLYNGTVAMTGGQDVEGG